MQSQAYSALGCSSCAKGQVAENDMPVGYPRGKADWVKARRLML